MAVSDKSLEPLLNQSTFGSGITAKISVVPVNEVAVGSNRTAITTNATAVQITPSTNVRTIHIQNTGSNNIYYGGAAVDENDGVIIYPGVLMVFNNVQDTFSVYLVSTGAATSTARISEFT